MSVMHKMVATAFVGGATLSPLTLSAAQTIDPRNPEQVGEISMAMARMENGKFVPFTPQQLENAMAMVYGGKLPNGTPGFVPQIAHGTNGGTPFGSPLNPSA